MSTSPSALTWEWEVFHFSSSWMSPFEYLPFLLFTGGSSESCSASSTSELASEHSAFLCLLDPQMWHLVYLFSPGIWDSRLWSVRFFAAGLRFRPRLRSRFWSLCKVLSRIGLQLNQNWPEINKSWPSWSWNKPKNNPLEQNNRERRNRQHNLAELEVTPEIQIESLAQWLWSNRS